MSDVRILVVEDEADSADMISFLLENQNFEVVTATNGLYAIQALEQMDFNLIVTDLAMPEMDGWNLLHEIRKSTISEIPVIAVTAYHSNRVLSDAEDAGFNGYFTKPLQVREFLDFVNNLLGL
jgi:CheY-like chemotaxis protein